MKQEQKEKGNMNQNLLKYEMQNKSENSKKIKSIKKLRENEKKKKESSVIYNILVLTFVCKKFTFF
jgi:hypothetical protein